MHEPPIYDGLHGTVMLKYPYKLPVDWNAVFGQKPFGSIRLHVVANVGCRIRDKTKIAIPSGENKAEKARNNNGDSDPQTTASRDLKFLKQSLGYLPEASLQEPLSVVEEGSF